LTVSKHFANGYADDVTGMDVDLDLLVDNFRQTKRHVAPAEVVAVVKSEAYGHGAVPVARHLSEQVYCRHFAVALVDEGVQLRLAGIDGEVMVMGVTLPSQFPIMAEHGLTPVLAGPAHIRAWADLARERGETLPYHIKVDVGLGRMGVLADDAEQMAELVRHLRPHARPVGVASHLSHPAGTEEHNRMEFCRFTRFCEVLDASVPGIPRHLAASQAAVRFPAMHLEMVRIGGLLYGLNHIPSPSLSPRPVMRYCTRLGQVKRLPAGWWVGYSQQLQLEKDTTVGIIPVGWTDGLTSYHVGVGSLLVRGIRCKIIGTCTDFAMIDVSGVPDPQLGEEVVLIGDQGGDAIDAIQLGKWAQISTGQLLGKISLRVPRRYWSGSHAAGKLSILGLDFGE